MEKRIGIITHYYRTRNYGGALQAYALQRFIEQMGLDCEQISFDFSKPYLADVRRKRLKNYIKILFHPWGIPKRIAEKTRPKPTCPIETTNRLAERDEAFQAFLDRIPHSEEVYDDKTIEKCSNKYDTVITGSDQVWNLKWYHPAFFLSFVKSGEKKIAYAASVSQERLTRREKKLFAIYLKDFTAISLREEQTVALVRECCTVEPVFVLDPTMLLSRQDWDEICAARLVPEAYIFCYYLGMDEKKSRLAQEFAGKKGLKIVRIPYLHQYDPVEDSTFGDELLYQIAPEQFLSLIKYAEYVLTDSFHACVFSNLYQKEFFVFNRDSQGSMSARIYSLMNLLGHGERFCDTPQRMNLDYIMGCPKIQYSEPHDLTVRREISQAFLRRYL